MKPVRVRIALFVGLMAGLLMVVAFAPQRSEAQRGIPTARVLDPSLFKVAPTARVLTVATPRAVATPRILGPADMRLNPGILERLCPNCVAYGGSVRGEVATAGGQGKHAMIGSAGDLVNVSVEREASSPKLDPIVELRDPDGKVVASNDNAAGNTVNSLIRDFKLPKGGTYSITVRSKGTGTGFYTLTLWRSNACGGPLNFSVAGVAVAREAISPLTRSCVYTFVGEKGRRLDFALRAIDSGLDPNLVLLDPSGKQVKANDNESPSSRNSRIITTLEADGTYKLIAGASGDRSTGRFELTVGPLWIPVSAPLCGSGSMPFGPELTGEITRKGPIGACRYTIFVTAGDLITIRMKATSSALNPLVKLLAAGNAQEAIGSPGGGGGESTIVAHRLQQSGSYTIVTGSFNDESTGAFKISAVLALPTPTATATSTRTPTATATKPPPVGPAPSPSPTPSPTLTPSPTPQPPLACGGDIGYGSAVADAIPLTGMFCEHLFTGASGDVISIWLAAEDGAFDPLVELIPPGGAEPEASNDDADFPNDRNSMISEHVLQQDGVYTIRARSFNDQEAGAYVLLLVKSN